MSGWNAMSGWNVGYSRWMERTNFELWISFIYDRCRRVCVCCSSNRQWKTLVDSVCTMHVCARSHHIATEDVRQRTYLHYFIRNACPGEWRVSNAWWMLPFIIIRRRFQGKYSISLCAVACRVTLNLLHVVLVTIQVEKNIWFVFTFHRLGADAHFD